MKTGVSATIQSLMMMRELSVVPIEPAQVDRTLTVMGNPVPGPDEIYPMEFFDQRGKRPVFIEHWMAKYMAAMFAPICYTEGIFYRYQNGVWKEFSADAIKQAIVSALKDHAKSTYVENTMKILSALIKRTEDQWITDSRYINCANGMVDIKEGKFLPHDPSYLSRTQLKANFDMDAQAPRWYQFLEEIFPEDKDKKSGELGKADIMQEYYGYCLLGDCRYQKALFMYGVGSNGKSTAIKALISVLGMENTSTLTIEAMSERFTTHFLQGKYLNFATETNTRNPMNTEKFKAAVRGDPITAERKYGSPYPFRPSAKWIVAMNETPVIPDKTYGFTRSLIVLEFKRRFIGAEKDADLDDKLAEEKDGILMWALFGLERLLRRRGFEIPETIEKEGEEFMKALNPFLIFVDEMCIIDPEQWVSSTILYKEYKEWCKEGENRPLSRNKFYDQILMNWPAVTKGLVGAVNDRKNGFKGIGLK